MAKQESPKDIIDAYRKQQQRSERTPKIIFGAAALLLIAGAAFAIIWLTGAENFQIDIGSIFASETPTPTMTATPTPVPPTPTSTLTPTEAPPTDTLEPSATPTHTGPVIYVVEEGDSFYSIAEKFDMDIMVLIEANRERLELDPVNPIIKVGDEVLVPPPGTELPTPTLLPENIPPGTRLEYSVQPGDTLAGIALKFNSTVEDIIEHNEDLDEDANVIYVGQILIIRVNLVTPVPTETESVPEPTSTPTPTP
ncbi:MAG: LysM peptidoglycan-binding domain-containing protein [Chloroflexota bacterium]|nr:LysM peptidoglycan-binding domain-containing protein [Chloroflexota bacterium]